MQVRPGSILIAHPVYAQAPHSEAVVFITESNSYSTSGLALNTPTDYNLHALLEPHGIDWQSTDTLYMGGDHYPSAMVMLHTTEWYSSNTMQIDHSLAISSDDLMIDKLEMGNTPAWYRLFVGCTAWDADDLADQLRSPKPQWLLLSKPSQVLIELADANIWHCAIAEYSQKVFEEYI